MALRDSPAKILEFRRSAQAPPQAQARADLLDLMAAITAELETAYGKHWPELAAIEGHALLAARRATCPPTESEPGSL